MKANETTIRNLLQGERQYVVPLYQRRYSWKRHNFAQLWSDLMHMAGEESAATHFLGSVVLAPSPANTPAGVQTWLVVDGQQRLTTLSILLCAIRDHVRDAIPQLAAKIDDLYLVNRYASGQERYTLLPTKADRSSWVGLVERAPDAGGEDRIGEAYRYFRAALVQMEESDDGFDVTRIEQAVAGRISIVEIAAHADDNVHRIFESLNYTGQPLTQADLLRNHLFMRLQSRGDEVYERQWLPLQELLTDRQLEQLVWLELVLRGDDRATQESIYHAQQERLKNLNEAEIEQWIIDLHHKARLFRRILDPRHATEPKLRQALDRLDRWGAAVVHPISLHVLLAHDAKSLTDGEAAASLRVVESYLVRRMITGIASVGSNRVLMSLVKELGDQIPTASAITRALSGPRRRFPSDQLIRDAVLANSFYWSGRGLQRSYVLRCLEEDYRHGEPLDFDRTKVTIEHVLPQSPTEEWFDMLRADLGDGETVEELHSSLVHTLGNLSLTAYNSKLANDGFAAKQKILADSGLAMNRDLARAQRWGRNEIHARGRALADRIIGIWPGPDETVGTAAPPTPRWPLMNRILASLPAGRWTSYSDIAEVIGSHQVAVGSRLGSVPVPNGHRVLKRNGSISPDFRWPDSDRQDDPRIVLAAEGVRFDESGLAAADQRMTSSELAALVLDDDAEEGDIAG